MEAQKNKIKEFQLPEVKRQRQLPEFVVIHGNVERLRDIVKGDMKPVNGGMELQKTEIKEFELPGYRKQPKMLPKYLVINGVVQRVNGFNDFRKLADQYN